MLLLVSIGARGEKALPPSLRLVYLTHKEESGSGVILSLVLSSAILT